MSNKRPSLPAYIRLPDGLRFAGTAGLSDERALRFQPKQAISPLPPEGLPVQLLVVGVGGDDETQVTVDGSIDAANSRELLLSTDQELPDPLLEALDPGAIVWLPTEVEADELLKNMRQMGREQLLRALRRFLVELGDQLFDLSTSSRYGISGQHAHYDALNMLKRNNDRFMETFSEHLMASLATTEKDKGQTFADLEAASAQNLDLVALDEMDQKLAVDKLVSSLIEKHRITLECLTIRSALVADIEPRKARTPFHPTYIVQAFTTSLDKISDSVEVIKDTLEFFGKEYAPVLDKLYPQLNELFIEAGIEKDLEEDIRENGSLLNPVEKRIIKSTVRPKDREAIAGAGGGGSGQSSGNAISTSGAEPATESESERHGKAAGADSGSGSSQDSAENASRDRHDSMYDAVVHALNTSRAAPAEDEEQQDADGIVADGEGEAAPKTDSLSSSETVAPTPIGDQNPEAGASSQSQERLLEALLAMQTQQLQAQQNLGDLEPLEELIKTQLGPDAESTIGRDGANRLGFVDNVFRTLHNNFEVSSDMAPSLARLRVPLARLSLREPRFFAQPDHPAHQLLNKISVLASADNSQNRNLLGKVSSIVDQVAESYNEDPVVFDEAQANLDALLAQQDRVYDRNVERVISGLEGQERLTRAQRRVERMLDARLGRIDSPKPIIELLEGGWRSALVQLALREDEDSVAWQEEAALLDSLLANFQESTSTSLSETNIKEMQLRLRALNKRLQASNPGSVAHEQALRRVNAVLTGRLPLATSAYQAALQTPVTPNEKRVEQLPRLRRWLGRVAELEPGARLRYRDKQGRRRQMRLIWVSDEKDRFAFVNERGQKIAELTAIQLARQLSRGAQSRSPVEDMSVLDQSMYETLEQAQRTLTFDRNRDQLTKLINGDSLLYQLQRSLRHAQARSTEHAFMLVDIDNFNLVNEVFDETSGDQVLGEFAQLLAQLNDRRALTARMKEDEFGVLLTYRSVAEAKVIANKIREDIARSSLNIGTEAVSFTVSIGIAAVVQASESPQSIVAQARSALELAKSQGRDQVVVFDVDQEEVLNYLRDKEASRKRLDEAMSTDGLVLRAQPIVQSSIDGSESATHHYEILLAIREENGELLSPQEFIQSAERFGYVTLVDRWVIKEAFSWISQLMDTQKEVPELSINLSGTSITENEFLDYVLEQISEYGVGTSRLCFEITETGAIDNLPRAADFVRTLQNIGCKFSLDDFGTGLASHKYLKELPVDYVKIDGTFITEVHKNRTDFAMAKSINDLAHFLGQKTVAECVESLDCVPALREIGIDYLQGWGIGLPRVLTEITEELANIET
ncbi:MAG: DUF1631 family protein [Pseudomonadota bacterium]